MAPSWLQTALLSSSLHSKMVYCKYGPAHLPACAWTVPMVLTLHVLVAGAQPPLQALGTSYDRNSLSHHIRGADPPVVSSHSHSVGKTIDRTHHVAMQAREPGQQCTYLC